MAPVFLPRPEDHPRADVLDIAMWVGASSYPFIPDFVEEVRRLGLSKKIPPGFPINRLTPGESKIVLIHPKAFPEFSYREQEANEKCKEGHPPSGGLPNCCTFAHYSLSALTHVDRFHEVDKTEEGPWIVTTLQEASCT